ncbi:MAG: FAD-dependent oxidoreductase [Anaerolineales bacterium]|nr:FAD-dependent oxidoreductase [Anaerolineales bacterium]
MTKTTLMFNEVNCSGCHACEVACKQEHGLGVGPRLVRVIERAPLFLPLYCHHCEDAPCAIACWEDAITIDPETGIVLHHNELCNGCLAVSDISGAEKQDTSPCMVECPAHNNVQGFVSLAAKGKFQSAIQIIKETSPFPSICGRVCPHPCEAGCNRDQIDEPVAIHPIERFLADHDRSNGKPYVPKVNDAKDEKVAVIGSGPAGLTAAYFLARDGYQVTVFEKLPVAGGMMAVGIPDFRLPKEVLSYEIQSIQDLGVEIKTGVTFGSDISFEDLKKEGYQAIFLATGLHNNIPLNIENENIDGVLRGIDFLRDVALGNSVSIGKKVIVVGGGNVAMDVAMTALRKGAEAVSLVCLECREDMPAWESEIQMALEEGVEIINSLGPNRFLSQDGKFAGIEFKRCTSVFDEDGTFNPQFDEMDLTTLDADNVVVAIGQVADLSFAKNQGISISSNGVLEADPVTLDTQVKGVFAGGEVVHGPASVAQAIGSGREAARSIDRYLSGRDLRLGRLCRDKAFKRITEPQKEIVDPSPRAQMDVLEPHIRIGSFDEIQAGFSEEMTLQEGNRCIMCGASCVQSCPYDVMQFNHEIDKAVKCDLCVDKRTTGEVPACTTVCPTRCIFWGDPKTFPNGSKKVL